MSRIRVFTVGYVCTTKRENAFAGAPGEKCHVAVVNELVIARGQTVPSRRATRSAKEKSAREAREEVSRFPTNPLRLETAHDYTYWRWIVMGANLGLSHYYLLLCCARTEKAFGNLVIIQRETRLYQSSALIPLGPSKITRDYGGFERRFERTKKGRRRRQEFASSQGGGSIFLTAI